MGRSGDRLLLIVVAGAAFEYGRRAAAPVVMLDRALLRRLIVEPGMKPAPFDYVAPATIEEACGILAEAGGGATVLAGGQTLMPLLNLRMSQPFIVVDINKIAELTGIAVPMAARASGR